MKRDNLLYQFACVSAQLGTELDPKARISLLVKLSADQTRSDAAGFYRCKEDENTESFSLLSRQGLSVFPEIVSLDNSAFNFINHYQKSVVVSEKGESEFDSILFSEFMNSGIAVPIRTGKKNQFGILILNSMTEKHYGGNMLSFMDALGQLSGGLFSDFLDGRKRRKNLKVQ